MDLLEAYEVGGSYRAGVGYAHGQVERCARQTGFTVIIGFVGIGNRTHLVSHDLPNGYHSTTGDQREQIPSVIFDSRNVVER